MTNAALEKGRLVKNKIQSAYTASNYWSSTENNSNNAWNVNFSDGNINNNNKYNSLTVRPCAALDEKRKEAWVDAFDDCCRHKKSSDSCIRYRINYEEDLFRLAAEVESGVYRPSTSICFCVTRPKLREVFAANFRDRIVHHWLMMKLNPLFEARFVEQGNVSFNCRKGFGTQAAVKAVRLDIFAVSKGYTEDAYVGRFDLVGFFMSIHKGILIDALREFVYDKYKGEDVDLVFSTLVKVIWHNPAKDCEIHGDPTLFDQLPANKSLFHAEEDRGLPIGNLTSQILANFYLSLFDEAMSKWCRERGGRYERFVDDFVVVMPRMKDVYAAFLFSRSFLWERLSVRLHDDKKYMQHHTKGIAFVGYVIKMDRVYLSNRTYGNFTNRLHKIDTLCSHIEEGEMNMSALAAVNQSLMSLNSYVGFTCHTNGYAKRMATLLKFRRMYRFAYLKTNRHVVKIKYNYNIGEIRYAKDRMERTRMSSALHRTPQRRPEANHRLYRRSRGTAARGIGRRSAAPVGGDSRDAARRDLRPRRNHLGNHQCEVHAR